MKLGWVSCLASIDRVTLADRTTFPHIINTLACLTGPILGKKKKWSHQQSENKLSKTHCEIQQKNI